MSGVVLADSVAAEFPQLPIMFLTAGDLALPHPAFSKSCQPEDFIAAVLRTCGPAGTVV